MIERKLKIALVGLGQMGQCAHLKNYAALPECEIVAVAELREDVREEVAARYSVPGKYPDHRAVLAGEKDLDGIVAVQPFTRHGILIPELLSAGVPVFIEKPLAGSVEVGEEIVQAARDNGTWVMVGYHKRSDPATQFARQEIARLKKSKALGALRYVRILMPAGDYVAGGTSDHIVGTGEPPALKHDPPPADMDEQTSEDYTRFTNYYIHQVNLMRHLMGEPYRVTYADPSGVVLVVESDSGVPGVIEMSPYRTSIDWQEEALIAFEHGYIKLGLPAPLAVNRPGRVEIFRDPAGGPLPQTCVPQLPWVHAMRQQAINFLAAIRGDAPPPCDAAEALEDLKVARDYIRLWKEGR